MYRGVLLQPRDIQLSVPDHIFCRILALAASICAFRDLLFTVVIHLLVKVHPRNCSKAVVLLWFSFYYYWFKCYLYILLYTCL